MTTICTTCGAKVTPGWAFCGSCGADLTAVRAPSSQTDTGGAAPPFAGDGERIAPPPTTPGGPQSTAEIAASSTYLGMRLLYEDNPHDLDPLTNPKYIGSVLIKFLLFIVLWFVGTAVFGALYALFGRSTSVDVFGTSSYASNGFGNFLIALELIWDFFLACLFWLMPVPSLLSEWKLTLGGKGVVAKAVLDHMAWIIHGRRTPLRSFKALSLSVPGQPSRDYLELREGFFAGYVSCFPYGGDLFVGWTFWLYMSPARWVVLAIGRIFQALVLRGSALYVTLRYDQAKAMRETLHDALRQGVDVAVGHLPAEGSGTIGSTMPVEAAIVRSF